MSLSSSQAVFTLLQSSPHPPPAGTGGISHRLSPAWTWSQRQPSAAVYVQLFHHLMGSKMSLVAPSSARGLFGLFPGEAGVPLSCRVLPQPTCRCWFFLLTACPLISVMLFVQRFCSSCPTHYFILTRIHVLRKLSGHRISMLRLFL